LWRWLQKPEPDAKLLSGWPIPRFPGWLKRVNEPLSQGELEAVRRAAQRGAPLGDQGWVESIARRLNLESTMRPRGRPRSRESGKERKKEA
jgi:putative transposase